MFTHNKVESILHKSEDIPNFKIQKLSHLDQMNSIYS